MPTLGKTVSTSRGSKAREEAKENNSKIAVPGNRGTKVVQAVTILKSPEELYNFWRDVRNLAQVVKHPVTITQTSANESHWVVSAPLGRRVEWDAVIINDEPGRLIAWRSRDGGDVDHAGSVRFDPAPGDEGTEIKVALEYDPPGGKVGAALAKLSRDAAGSQVYDALRRLKALMEAGEIPTTAGQPAGGSRRNEEDES
ncbi:MAG: SRPBCC family protein [Nibricoccus sp.]